MPDTERTAAGVFVHDIRAAEVDQPTLRSFPSRAGGRAVLGQVPGSPLRWHTRAVRNQRGYVLAGSEIARHTGAARPAVLSSRHPAPSG